MSHLLQPQILVVPEGTDNSKGKGQILSNIKACLGVVDCISSTLGPRGFDKLISTEKDFVITNDGATILNMLEIDHPAANLMVDIAKSQDSEIGDGTTSVVILCGEFLKEARKFIEDGMPARILIKGFNAACQLAIDHLDSICIVPQQETDFLIKCACTALNSKLIYNEKQFFAQMVVDAINIVGNTSDKKAIGIKEVEGASTTDSFLVKGVAFKRTYCYAGYEMMPKYFENPKILCLISELEHKDHSEETEVWIEDVDEYEGIISAEWNILLEKLKKIKNSGANIVLVRRAVGDAAAQFFADNGIFAAGRVRPDDLKRVCAATGAKIQNSLNKLEPSIMGTCGIFREIQVGSERYNIFEECKQTKSATFILRGGTEQYIKEAGRSLNDAIEVVRRAKTHQQFVPGGGAIDMELSRYLRDYSRTIEGKQQLVINSYARALEIIPKTLAANAGFDCTDILNKLRQQHAQGNKWMGVDIQEGTTCDMLEAFIWEPILIKRNCLQAATEAANLILSIDETVKLKKDQDLIDKLEEQKQKS